jgi:hypothetical protein
MSARRGVRVEDLPPAVRRRLSAPSEPSPEPTRPTRRRRSRPDGLSFRCYVCGHTSTTWAGAERHAHAERHGRIEVVFPHPDGVPVETDPA